MTSSADATLAAHKVECYRGIARIRLQSLHFQHPLVLERHREESQKNVRRLQRIFKKTGCFRLQDENVINAVVEEDQLDAALHTINLTTDDFRNIHSARDAPALALTAVYCLEGLHCIKAAEIVLGESDKWWVVRLFSWG
jgi:AraC-like DNA-binding protein